MEVAKFGSIDAQIQINFLGNKMMFESIEKLTESYSQIGKQNLGLLT